MSKKSKKNSKSKTPKKSPLPTWEEIIPIVDKVMLILGRRFRFGCYTPDDLKQEAYILAYECLPRWDGVRSLPAFIYTHLHNRLSLIKRMKYQRLEPPCTSCPLKAYINKECTAYTHLEDCKHYAGWLERNNSKRSLMSVRIAGDYCDFTDPTKSVDDQDEWEYAMSFFTPEERAEIESTKTVSIDDVKRVVDEQ